MRNNITEGIWLGIRLCLFALIIACPLSYYAVNIEPEELNVNKVNLIVGLEKPVKIIFITDIHIETISDDIIKNVIDSANAENPDYIFLGGDFASTPDPQFDRLSVLGKLKSKKGTYAVLGNHDYYLTTNCSDKNGSDHELDMKEFFKSKRIRILQNDIVKTDDFTIIGLDPYISCNSNFTDIFIRINRSSPNIVLVHDQEAIPENQYENLNLVLAGHTHCGQIRLPILGSVTKMTGLKGKYDMGLHEFDNDSYLYVSCGIGFGPRFLSPPDIAVIELS